MTIHQKIAELKQKMLDLESKIQIVSLAETIVQTLGWKHVDVDLAERMIPYLREHLMGEKYWGLVNRKTAREDCMKIFPKPKEKPSAYVRMALWYIEKCHSPEAARDAFEKAMRVYDPCVQTET